MTSKEVRVDAIRPTELAELLGFGGAGFAALRVLWRTGLAIVVVDRGGLEEPWRATEFHFEPVNGTYLLFAGSIEIFLFGAGFAMLGLFLAWVFNASNGMGFSVIVPDAVIEGRDPDAPALRPLRATSSARLPRPR